MDSEGSSAAFWGTLRHFEAYLKSQDMSWDILGLDVRNVFVLLAAFCSFGDSNASVRPKSIWS